MGELNKKLALFSVLIISLLLTINYYGIKEESNVGSCSATLILDFGNCHTMYKGKHTIWKNGEIIQSVNSTDNSTTYEFQNLTIKNGTVFSLLRKSSDVGNFSVKYSDPTTEQGIFVESIAGVKNGDGNWQYYINGEYGIRSSDRTIISNGDLIEWKYE